jgi:hypothetical protein
MKKQISIGMTAVFITVVLSFTGANADEKNNSGENNKSSNSSQEFKGAAVRSHGHPVANLTEKPAAGSRQQESSSVNNDDAASEMEWQKWNKVNSQAAAKAIGSLASNPITFHAGGSIGLMTGDTQLVPVWVGNWSQTNKDFWNTRMSALVSSLAGGSINTVAHIFNTNTLYYSLRNAQLPKLTWASVTTTANIPANLQKASGGITPVSDANVATYINRALTSKVISAPTNGRVIYIYIGAADTRLSSGFGTAYCGWHTYGNLGATNIPYIAIQDFTSNYYRACSAQTISPNGNVAFDAMASVLVHEIDEALTDADLRTWYDARGAENADKCAWDFGITSLDNNGAKYNFTSTTGGYKYLIQRNWLADNLVKDSVAGTACSITG